MRIFPIANSASFKGTPTKLIHSNNAIENYNKLANGSYLDIHDDLFAPQNKLIRKSNLSFLDNIFYSYKTKEFIDYFKNITKFPKLEAVSENIENEFINSLRKVSTSLNKPEYEIIAAGYDGTCSVGKRTALPGSDLDKAFVIIKGRFCESPNELKKTINTFSGELWHQTDQRILSYNHDTSFPNIMTLGQINYMMDKINNITDRMNFDSTKMAWNVENEYIDLIKASEFNILLANRLPKRKYDDDCLTLNKENAKNFAYFIESLRDGKKVIKTKEYDELIENIKDTDFYRYSNVAQMKAMKNAVESGREQKTKIILRKNLEKDFENWPRNQQFYFIRTLIDYSCEDQCNFEEYFNNDRNVKENYKPLLGLLCYGDINRRLNPDFEIYPDRVNIFLSKDKPTTLFRGFADNVLWINSTIKNDIEDVLLHVDKLRKIDLFKNISKVQAPIDNISDIVPGFYPIQYVTKKGQWIAERRL